MSTRLHPAYEELNLVEPARSNDDDWLGELSAMGGDEIPLHLQERGGKKKAETAHKPAKPRVSEGRRRRAEKLERELTDRNPDQFFRTFALQVITGDSSTPMFPPLWLDAGIIAPVRGRIAEVYNGTRLAKTIMHKPPHGKARRSHKALTDNVQTLLAERSKELLQGITSYKLVGADLQAAEAAQQKAFAALDAVFSRLDASVTAAADMQQLQGMLQQLADYHALTNHPQQTGVDAEESMRVAAIRYASIAKAMGDIVQIVAPTMKEFMGAAESRSVIETGAKKYAGGNAEIARLHSQLEQMNAGFGTIYTDMATRLDQYELVYARANYSWLKEHARHAVAAHTSDKAAGGKDPVSETAATFALMFPGLKEDEALAASLEHHTTAGTKGGSGRGRWLLAGVAVAALGGTTVSALGGVDETKDTIWKLAQVVADGACPEGDDHRVMLHDDVKDFNDLAETVFPKTIACYESSQFDPEKQLLARDVEGDALVDVVFVSGPYVGQRVMAPFDKYLELGALGLLQADEDETEEPAVEVPNQDEATSKPVPPLSQQAQTEMADWAAREAGQPERPPELVAAKPVVRPRVTSPASAMPPQGSGDAEPSADDLARTASAAAEQADDAMAVGGPVMAGASAPADALVLPTRADPPVGEQSGPIQLVRPVGQ